MFVGKNIHFSALDHKPLCSFSAKLCRQRRLNGYAFCVRHILEDPSAPFKACAYVTKYSRNKCSNPVPKHDERQYCNNHLQLLSGTNRKEKKPKGQAQHTAPHINNVPAAPTAPAKEQTNTASPSPQGAINCTTSVSSNMLDNRMTLQDRLKTKFNLCQKENGPEDEDLDDPYAFPDSEPVRPGPSPPVPPPVPPLGPPPVTDSPPANHVTASHHHITTSVNNIVPSQPSLSPVIATGSSVGSEKGSTSSKVSTPENSNHASAGAQCPVPIAKLYPELAEKLERARVKPEVKLKQESKSSRSSTRSSRTMNQLQNKIAQNKIKDKLKKNQGQSNQATPEQQPSTPQPQLSPVPAGGSAPSSSSSVVSVLQTALTPDPAVSPKLPFPCSTLNVNVKNALSNMLKSDPGAITSIPIGLPRHLLHHTPAPPSSQTVSAHLQQQQQQQHQQQLQQQIQLNLSQQSHSHQSIGQSSPTTVAVSSSSHPQVQQHLSPARAATPPKVSLSETPHGMASLVPPGRGIEQFREFPSRGAPALIAATSSVTSLSPVTPSMSSPMSGFIPHQHVSLSTMQSELAGQGVLPPPYPHTAVQSTSHAKAHTTSHTTSQSVLQSVSTNQLKQEPLKSQFMQQMQQQKAQFTQPYLSPATVCSQVPVSLSLSGLGGPVPSRPPPAYPHPPPALTVSSQGAVTTTVTPSSAAVSPVPPAQVLSQTATTIATTSSTTTGTAPKTTSSASTNCLIRPKRPRNLLTGREAKKRLKRHSSVKVYAYHASQKMQNVDILPFSVDDASDDSDYDEQLPWQKNWYVPSSDEEDNEEDDDDSNPLLTRTAKLALLRARLRRQFTQLRKAQKVNAAHRGFQEKALQSLLVAAKHSSEAATSTILEIRHAPYNQKRSLHARLREQEQCSYSGDEHEDSCTTHALPFTNHCIKHIMHSADQQLFDHCTAKFSDNSQCCVPVFDIRHELPLCPEHAAKADNYNKNPEPRPKKPRKKTKPSALTRPPRKGKKKKNQRRNVRPQKPMPPLEPTGNTSMPDDMSDGRTPPRGTPKTTVKSEPVLGSVVTTSTVSATSPSSASPSPSSSSVSSSTTTNTKAAGSHAVPMEVTKDLRDLKDITHDLDKMVDLDVALSPGVIEKNLGLPIDSEQATNFLDEHDLHDVLNRLPEEAFDIFSGQGLGELSKNGEFLPSKEEAEELERALAEASQDVDSFKQSLKQLSQGGPMMMPENDNDDEIAKQIADQILQQNLSPSHLDEDMNQDNLNDLASSISASDLNTFSQAFSSSSANMSTADLSHQGTATQSVVAAPGVLGSVPSATLQPPRLAPQTALQALQMLRSQGQGAGGQPQVIQTQLAHGALSQGLQIAGLPAGLAAFTIGPQGALIPASVPGATQQRALLSDHLAQGAAQATFTAGDVSTLAPVPRFNNGTALTASSIAPNITITQSPPLALPASTATSTQNVQWSPLGNATSQNQMRFQNRFPVLQQQQQQQQQPTPPLQQQQQQPLPSVSHANLAASLAAAPGMKLAFPLPTFIQTDLGAMIAATTSSASSAGNSDNVQAAAPPDFSLNRARQGLAAPGQAFGLATTTVVSSAKRQPPAST